MPKSAQYTVSWSLEQAKYHFTGPEWEAYLPSLEGGKGWLEWLEEHHAFAFHGRNGQINLLKATEIKKPEAHLRSRPAR